MVGVIGEGGWCPNACPSTIDDLPTACTVKGDEMWLAKDDTQINCTDLNVAGRGIDHLAAIPLTAERWEGEHVAERRHVIAVASVGEGELHDGGIANKHVLLGNDKVNWLMCSRICFGAQAMATKQNRRPFDAHE